MDPGEGLSLAEQLDRIDEEELATNLRALGEVTEPRRIARRILRARQAGALHDTVDLAQVAAEGRTPGRIHPATRVFQALRMLVNREVEELSAVLRLLPGPLRPGGRAVFIAFHSVEDRMVKQRLLDLEGRCQCPPGIPVCRCGNRQVLRVLFRRAVRPTGAEQARNPRARSARLRAAERLAA
jgi:16S rRNA (cytosine1402-N4)-methyltransferase